MIKKKKVKKTVKKVVKKVTPEPKKGGDDLASIVDNWDD